MKMKIKIRRTYLILIKPKMNNFSMMAKMTKELKDLSKIGKIRLLKERNKIQLILKI
jgi:hypothetical protein